MIRLRITFEKKDALRYISHLDTQKVWTRAMLRANLPLAYTQGFHPVPKVAYAWPLPLGWSTKGELIDIWLDRDAEGFVPAEFIASINAGMPAGLRVLNAEVIDLFSDALTNVITSAIYRVVFPEGTSAETVREEMTALTARETIPHERRGKMIDLKPLIDSWEVSGSDGRAVMIIQMAARNSAMGRPDELLTELGYDMFRASFERTAYILAAGK